MNVKQTQGDESETGVDIIIRMRVFFFCILIGFLLRLASQIYSRPLQQPFCWNNLSDSFKGSGLRIARSQPGDIGPNFTQR